MAEKVLIVNVCDRCDHEERAGTKKTLPKDWMKVGKDIDLCPFCTAAFETWMNQAKKVSAENQDAAANAGVQLNIQPLQGEGVDTAVSRAMHNAAVHLGMTDTAVRKAR